MFNAGLIWSDVFINLVATFHYVHFHLLQDTRFEFQHASQISNCQAVDEAPRQTAWQRASSPMPKIHEKESFGASQFTTRFFWRVRTLQSSIFDLGIKRPEGLGRSVQYCCLESKAKELARQARHCDLIERGLLILGFARDKTTLWL